MKKLIVLIVIVATLFLASLRTFGDHNPSFAGYKGSDGGCFCGGTKCSPCGQR